MASYLKRNERNDAVALLFGMHCHCQLLPLKTYK